MNTRWKRYETCGCQGYWFPHRRGSLYCHYRASGELRQYEDADFRDRELDAMSK